MGFWDAYNASLKPREVEEPIDRFLFRPIGYVVAKVLAPTPVSPDAVTVLAGLTGLIAGLVLVAPSRYRLEVGGVLILLANVLDCADGQLARMRGTSSVFGRILDGFVDLVMTLSAALAALWLILERHLGDVRLLLAIAVAGGVTMVTSWWHTVVFDVSKGYWLRFTDPKFREEEAETHDRAVERWEKSRAEIGSPLRQRLYKIYLVYTMKEAQLARWLGLSALPRRPFDAGTASLYRRYVGRAWTVVRALFGSSALVFGLALFVSLGAPEIYLVLRLVALNAVLFFYVVPTMRRASRLVHEAITEQAA